MNITSTFSADVYGSSHAELLERAEQAIAELTGIDPTEFYQRQITYELSISPVAVEYNSGSPEIATYSYCATVTARIKSRQDTN